MGIGYDIFVYCLSPCQILDRLFHQILHINPMPTLCITCGHGKMRAYTGERPEGFLKWEAACFKMLCYTWTEFQLSLSGS